MCVPGSESHHLIANGTGVGVGVGVGDVDTAPPSLRLAPGRIMRITHRDDNSLSHTHSQLVAGDDPSGPFSTTLNTHQEAGGGLTHTRTDTHATQHVALNNSLVSSRLPHVEDDECRYVGPSTPSTPKDKERNGPIREFRSTSPCRSPHQQLVAGRIGRLAGGGDYLKRPGWYSGQTQLEDDYQAARASFKGVLSPQKMSPHADTHTHTKTVRGKEADYIDDRCVCVYA